jgi:hypothetical protein
MLRAYFLKINLNTILLSVLNSPKLSFFHVFGLLYGTENMIPECRHTENDTEKMKILSKYSECPIPEYLS